MTAKASIGNQIKRGVVSAGIIIIFVMSLGTVWICAPPLSDYLRWHWRYLQRPQADLNLAQDRISRSFGISNFQLSDYYLEERQVGTYTFSQPLRECDELRTYVLKPKRMQIQESGRTTLVMVYIVRRLITTGVTLFFEEAGKPGWYQIGDIKSDYRSYCPQEELSAEEVKLISRVSKSPIDPSIEATIRDGLKKFATKQKGVVSKFPLVLYPTNTEKEFAFRADLTSGFCHSFIYCRISIKSEILCENPGSWAC